MRYRFFGAIIVTLSIGVFFSDTSANPNKPKEQFVYKMGLFDGKKIAETFLPQSEDAIYILAGENNVLSPRITLVKWWPLSGQFVAEFQELNEEVPGTLEIFSEGKKIAGGEKQEYVIFYPNTISGDLSEMYVGREAYTILKEYKDPLMAYYERYDEYNRKMVAFQNAFMAYAEKLEKQKGGGIELDPEEIRAAMPKMPKPPDKPDFDITGLKRDFVVNLPEGYYTVRLRGKNGTIVEGSQKELIAFSRRRAGGIGYEIIPQNRWTKRENSNDPLQTIYAVGENTLYLRGFYEDEYNELYYRKLRNPQSQGSMKRWIWAHIRPIKRALLAFKSQSDGIAKIPELPYLVKQTPGPKLGYKILPYTDNEKGKNVKPSFEAHMINIRPASSSSVSSLWLQNEKGGMLDGSKRRILQVRKEGADYLYMISLFPLILGAIIIFRRRRFTA